MKDKLALISLAFFGFLPLSATGDSFGGTEYRNTYAFPDHAYSRLLDALATPGAELRDYAGLVRPIICSGSSSKFHITYRIEYTPPSTKGMFVDDAAIKRKESLDEFRSFLKNDFFAISADNRVDHFVNGLYVPHFEDLEMLSNMFTFRLPKKTIAQLVGFKPHSYVDMPEIKQWGYRYSSGEFSPSLAVENRKSMWKKIFASQTTLLEAPKPGGKVDFILKLDLKVLCAHGVSIMDLISE